ncbi:glycine--tRNA ligase subunit alpha [Streptomyces sp. NBC_01515]|uniref:glycine--tRNA ligase subunit alpha n=1 Tax=Streptomyces sp. NBC_01515 TaxID=2903890 RepID=UPI00386580C2
MGNPLHKEIQEKTSGFPRPSSSPARFAVRQERSPAPGNRLSRIPGHGQLAYGSDPLASGIHCHKHRGGCGHTQHLPRSRGSRVQSHDVAAYTDPSVRSDNSRYCETPNRPQTHTPYQVVLKPEPGTIHELFLGSLRALRIETGPLLDPPVRRIMSLRGPPGGAAVSGTRPGARFAGWTAAHRADACRSGCPHGPGTGRLAAAGRTHPGRAG